MDNVKSIAAGRVSSFIIKTDNTLWATGYNVSGQFGDGTTTNKNIPVKIMDQVKLVAGSESLTIIQKTDNSFWTAGTNDRGQLGDGTNMNRLTFVKMYLP
jgi:alpha-tubulin suppressor-like RCC1 family protein